MEDGSSHRMMVIIAVGVLLLIVIGYIATPFVAKNARAQRSVSAEQRNKLETAIEQDVYAVREQDEETSLQAEE